MWEVLAKLVGHQCSGTIFSSLRNDQNKQNDETDKVEQNQAKVATTADKPSSGSATTLSTTRG